MMGTRGRLLLALTLSVLSGSDAYVTSGVHRSAFALRTVQVPSQLWAAQLAARKGVRELLWHLNQSAARP